MNVAELDILFWIREHLTTPFLDWLMPFVSSLVNHGELWILLAAVLVCFKRTRPVGVAMGIALAGGLLVGNGLLKNLVARVRPYDLTEVTLLVERLSDFSFPSGHTLASFEAATVLTVYHRRFGIAALVLATVIAFSRLYLFMHYPTDVVAGALLGVGIALLACRLIDWLRSHKQWTYKQK